MVLRQLILVGLIVVVVSGQQGPPHLDRADPDEAYHGLIREDELTVEVKPAIRATGPQICGYRITNRHHGGEIPFEILLEDEQSGLGKVRAKRQLNCEKRKNYKFDFAAVSCSGVESDNATLHITVTDVNEYSPVFLEPSYVKQVDEGKLYNSILRVEATDRDCSAKYGDVCKYEITSENQPFAIDHEGVVRNTEPLDYDKSHNHIMSIVAYDCGMKSSSPVLVTIKVARVCQLGWSGIPERIDFTPGAAKQELFPEAKLQLCDVPCSIKMIEAKLKLSTSHIGKGCDRDTYSVHSQRKMCGASTSSIDLLPTPGMGAEWTKSLPQDEGRDSDPMFEFDGTSTAVLVPPSVFPPDPSVGLPTNFTISTWMRREGGNEDRHAKEHVICTADDHKMNRHHFALFVRNCRLILLIRREHAEGDLNTFRPAEWRWKVPQVCSPSTWHHYSIAVTFPTATLTIDGMVIKPDKSNPEVIDDWPLHPTGLNTTTSIGACWQGSESKFKHHFKGYLAGLSFLPNKIEDEQVLKCLHKCKENLVVPGMEVIQPGMELMTNTDMTEITVEGENATDVEGVIKKVGYLNTREFPTPGRRNIQLTTKVVCESGKTIKILPSDSFVMVLPPQKPTIIINGTTNLPRDYEDFRLGVRVFSDVRVTISSSAAEDGDSEEVQWRNDEPVSVIERKLDACTVTLYPPLNPDHESLSVPIHMIGQLGIVEKISTDGIVLSGADMIYNYEQVLRQIQYVNRKPAYYLNRAFKLVCSELNGRFNSNEYIQTLTVIHPDLTRTEEPPKYEELDNSIPAAHRLDEHSVEFRPAKEGDKVGFEQLPPSHAVTVIIVVCVGFLLFMIALGVVRIRAARAAQEELQDAELAWDDSGLNITINPMETMTPLGPPSTSSPPSGEDSSDSEPSDSEDDEEDPTHPIHQTRKNQLDWDPSI